MLESNAGFSITLIGALHLTFGNEFAKAGNGDETALLSSMPHTPFVANIRKGYKQIKKVQFNPIKPSHSVIGLKLEHVIAI